MLERLDKILSNYGGLSRSDAKTAVKSGRVKINDSIVKDPSIKVKDTDEVTLDGKKLTLTRYRYYMLNKPKGYISSTEPEPGDESPNVIGLFKADGVKGLFPVGRMDKDTTGLLLITNDGELGHRLTAPGKHVDKTYIAKVKGVLNESAVEAFLKGFEFKEFVSAPAKLEITDSGTVEDGVEFSTARVTIHEGKFHQVKRMFARVGCEVVELKRITMGNIRLNEGLKPGEYKELKPEELDALNME